MAVKVMVFLIVVGFVLWVFEYLPRRLKPGRDARFRYRVFAVIALIAAAALLKRFL
jgi:hypothetical protein